MKPVKLLLLTVVSLFAFNIMSAQTKNYEARWKKVEDLVQKKNLPQSALKEVRLIYAEARKDRQDAQVIKSLVYMVNLQQDNREENQIASIIEIEKEIQSVAEPAASILKSYLAGLYWQYYQQNRWQLYNRTTTTNFVKTDIASWSVEDFHQRISALFLQSIAREDILKKTALAPYDAIIIKGNARNLRPTLYDLLAHHAIQYFSNSERDIKKPAFAFEISQPEAFAEATAFARFKFITGDSSSLQHKALQVYQDLIQFHLTDANPSALIDVDINRIQYVYANSVLEDKDERYRDALQRIISRFPEIEITAKARYLLAAYYYGLANYNRETGDTSHNADLLKAKEILDRIVADSTKKSEAWASSYQLLREITQKTFSFLLEKVNLPAQPFRALVNYKNISQLHFRMIRSTDALLHWTSAGRSRGAIQNIPVPD